MSILKNIFSFIIIAGVLLFMQSCGVTPGDASWEEIHSGTAGLVIYFDPETTPSEVYEGTKFFSNINIENLGAENIREGIAKIISDDYLIIRENDKTSEIKIDGKSKYDLRGGSRRIRINLESKKLPNSSQIHNSLIIAKTCYKYSTTFVSQACIESQIKQRDDEEEATCEVRIIGGGSQGAPIEVFSVEPRYIEEEDKSLQPAFTVRIRNANNGQVAKSERYTDMCNAVNIGNDTNLVKVTAILGEKPMKCISSVQGVDEDYIRLIDGEGSALCTFPDTINLAQTPYVSAVQVRLDYAYSDTASTSIAIRRYS